MDRIPDSIVNKIPDEVIFLRFNAEKTSSKKHKPKNLEPQTKSGTQSYRKAQVENAQTMAKLNFLFNLVLKAAVLAG